MSDATGVPERWLPVIGYPDYEVSDLGRVRSLPRLRRDGRNWLKGRVLKLVPASHGYPMVTLWRDGKEVKRTVHSLVMEMFVGPRPPGQETRHLDGNRANARLSNLAYGTHAENMQDMKRHGTDRNYAKTHCPADHEYTPANTGTRKIGGRYCKTCRRLKMRAQRALLRAA